MFRRYGFLGSGAQIVDLASKRQIATFKSTWRGGATLNFADGQAFRLECKGVWRPVWSVTTAGHQPVLHLRTREKAVELPAGVHLEKNRLSLLVMFAWYRFLQAEQDAASAAAVCAS